jgi:outer membrane protein
MCATFATLSFEKRMKKIIGFCFFFTLILQTNSNAQAKKWTLEECVQYALEHNITIKQTELDAQITKLDKSTAIGNFLPTLNANANHSWNIGLNQNITTGLLENQTTQFTSSGLNAGIDIYNGLQNQNRFRRSQLSIIGAQYQLSKIKDDISLNVANAYLQILFNIENLKVQQEQLAIDEKQLARTEELVNAGSLPKGDILDSKATVAGDRQRVINAENTLLISKLSLAQLLQLEKFQDFDVAEVKNEAKQSEVMLQSPEAILAKAKENRMEVKIARNNVAIAEKDVKIAKGAYQPNIQGFYSFSTRASYADRISGIQVDALNPIVPTGSFVNVGGTNYDVFQANRSFVFGKAAPIFEQFSDNKGHNFGVQMSVPILNGFSARNNVARNKISLEKSKLALDQSELDLERTIYTVYTDANGALRAYESAKQALEARENAYNYAKERYAVGMMNAFDFNQAQSLFTNAQSELLRTKYDFIFRTKIVEFYFGLPIIK